MAKEILTIRIIITGNEMKDVEDMTYNDVYFTGYCETEIFKGVVLPGGCDHQQYKNGTLVRMCAEYTMEGIDQDEKHCKLQIVNLNEGNGLTPTIHTDSTALKWIETATLYSEITDYPGGVMIHIYQK